MTSDNNKYYEAVERGYGDANATIAIAISNLIVLSLSCLFGYLMSLLEMAIRGPDALPYVGVVLGGSLYVILGALLCVSAFPRQKGECVLAFFIGLLFAFAISDGFLDYVKTQNKRSSLTKSGSAK
jgi:hypothetical protein